MTSSAAATSAPSHAMRRDRRRALAVGTASIALPLSGVVTTWILADGEPIAFTETGIRPDQADRRSVVTVRVMARVRRS